MWKEHLARLIVSLARPLLLELFFWSALQSGLKNAVSLCKTDLWKLAPAAASVSGGREVAVCKHQIVNSSDLYGGTDSLHTLFVKGWNHVGLGGTYTPLIPVPEFEASPVYVVSFKQAILHNETLSY